MQYLHHEPYDFIKNYLKEGIKQTTKILIVHHFSVKILKIPRVVIVPSEYALELFNRKDIKFCKNVVKIPLLFDDEFSKEINVGMKRYISFIGHAVKGHGFEDFIRFIKYAYDNGLQYQFQIATPTDVSRYLRRYKFLSNMISSDRLKIKHGRILSNEEINEAYETSLCVWNIYRRSPQSGVLPKAFMFGAPVIAGNIGSFPEFIVNGYNGFLVDKEDFKTQGFKLLERTLAEIRTRIAGMSVNARETFLRTFYFRSQKGIFNKLLESLGY